MVDFGDALRYAVAARGRCRRVVAARQSKLTPWRSVTCCTLCTTILRVLVFVLQLVCVFVDKCGLCGALAQSLHSMRQRSTHFDEQKTKCRYFGLFLCLCVRVCHQFALYSCRGTFLLMWDSKVCLGWFFQFFDVRFFFVCNQFAIFFE